jgi:hypothetical protein
MEKTKYFLHKIIRSPLPTDLYVLWSIKTLLPLYANGTTFQYDVILTPFSTCFNNLFLHVRYWIMFILHVHSDFDGRWMIEGKHDSWIIQLLYKLEEATSWHSPWRAEYHPPDKRFPTERRPSTSASHQLRSTFN